MPNMNFANMDHGDVLEQFDFDAFLQDEGGQDFSITGDLGGYNNFGDPEADTLNA